jgi:hypothetical protein
MNMRNGTLLLGFFALLVFPDAAVASWGYEVWGTMVWGQAGSGPGVPGVQGFGLIALAVGLSGTAAWRLRRRRAALGLPVLLVLIAIPLVVVAGAVSVPNTFVNGEIADADEVNANFVAVVEGIADTALGINATQCAWEGGSWNEATSTCVLSYNCFAGGFCAQAVISVGNLANEVVIPNVYEGHTPDSGPALEAECNVGVGLDRWNAGASTLSQLSAPAAQFAYAMAPCGPCRSNLFGANDGSGGLEGI